jgi:hypothetical protein
MPARVMAAIEGAISAPPSSLMDLTRPVLIMVMAEARAWAGEIS